MRFSLFVLPFVAAVSALPLFQPAAHISAQCVDPLPLGKFSDNSLRPTLRSLIHSHKIGVILRRIPELDVSEVIAEFNATSHGALPTLPPFAVPLIQRGYDILHGGAQFVGKHPIMADFAAKVAGFHWGSGHGDADLSMESIGDYKLPAWMMELIEELVELLEGHGDGKVRVVLRVLSGLDGKSDPKFVSQSDRPVEGSTPSVETATTTGVPSVDAGTPIPTTSTNVRHTASVMHLS